MKRLCIAIALLSVMPLFGQTGAISVMVKDDAGVGVPNALLSLSPRPMAVGPQNKVVLPASVGGIGRTKADGSATVANVPVGAYVLCVQDPAGRLVDSCAWEPDPSTVLVQAGKITAAPLTMKRGAIVLAQVNDPLLLLAAFSDATAPVHLSMGIPGKPVTVPMTLAQKTAGLWQYSLVVPANSNLKLNIATEKLKLADQSGKTLNAEYPKTFIPITTGAATTAYAVRLNVTGVL